MKDLYQLLGIEGNSSTAYHPQKDRQNKHINQKIEQYLRVYINFRQNDQSEWLFTVEFSYNDKVQTSTGHSPFFVNYGHHSFKGSNLHTKVQSEFAQQFGECMSKVWEEVETSLKIVAETIKQFYNQTKRESI